MTAYGLGVAAEVVPAVLAAAAKMLAMLLVGCWLSMI